MNKNIRLAIQKKGRLNSETIKLIRECGITLPGANGQLRAEAENFPMEILFLRDDDIPGYVSEGIADIGIAGVNLVREQKKDVSVVSDLGFSNCRLSIAVDKNRDFSEPKNLEGMRIATSHPNILNEYLKQKGITADIFSLRGSVEIAPAIGLADAICDLVSSGSTLLSNGLKEVITIMKSSAVLISNKTLPTAKQKLLSKFVLRIQAVLRSKEYKYILLNAPSESMDNISKLLPGMKSPTVIPLREKGWVSVHSVIKESQFWSIIEKLRELGAQGILVMSVEKMIM